MITIIQMKCIFIIYLIIRYIDHTARTAARLLSHRYRYIGDTTGHRWIVAPPMPPCFLALASQLHAQANYWFDKVHSGKDTIG